MWSEEFGNNPDFMIVVDLDQPNAPTTCIQWGNAGQYERPILEKMWEDQLYHDAFSVDVNTYPAMALIDKFGSVIKIDAHITLENDRTLVEDALNNITPCNYDGDID